MKPNDKGMRSVGGQEGGGLTSSLTAPSGWMVEDMRVVYGIGPFEV